MTSLDRSLRGLLLPTAPLIDGKRGVYADD